MVQQTSQGEAQMAQTETIANKGAVAAEILLGPMVRWRARGQWNGHEAES